MQARSGGGSFVWPRQRGRERALKPADAEIRGWGGGLEAGPGDGDPAAGAEPRGTENEPRIEAGSGGGMSALEGQGDASGGRNTLFIYHSDDFMAVKLHFPKLQILQ